ncbi:MAG: radical SAM protein [Actinomycetota bacterium]|nr:radical SAM protein [Actinomycetota bacterium]
MTSVIADAVADGTLSGRVWFYSNYHCNLACTYCLTESAPEVPKRLLSDAAMRTAATQAAALGFTDLGITGGEPFLAPGIVDTLDALTDTLPTLVLSNGTRFTEALVRRMSRLAGRDLAVQVSLDSPDPEMNDAMRGPENFARVVDAIPRLVDAGVRVRIATTATALDPDAAARLCELHRGLGVADADHVVRPIVSRGRGIDHDDAVGVSPENLPPELTITADGAFWSPFGPTVRNGRLDTDLLVTRTTNPLRMPAEELLGLVAGRPPGGDTTMNIR